jgi:hypothetical protein
MTTGYPTLLIQIDDASNALSDRADYAGLTPFNAHRESRSFWSRS